MGYQPTFLYNRGYMLVLRAALVACLLALPATLTAQPQQVVYSIQEYGSRYAVVALNGPAVRALTVNPNADGLGVRISGIGISFASSKGSSRSLVTSAQVVQRGPTTDLVLSFGAESRLNVTGTSRDLKLMIRRVGESSLARATASGPKSSSTSPTPTPSGRIPSIRIVSSVPTMPEATAGITVSLPGIAGLESNHPLGRHLRTLAYLVDMLWAWSSATPLRYREGQIALVSPEPAAESAKLEELIQDLTRELVEVRAEIQKKNDELATCRKPKP